MGNEENIASAESEYIKNDSSGGIKFDIFGILLYCEISINNVNCNSNIASLEYELRKKLKKK